MVAVGAGGRSVNSVTATVATPAPPAPSRPTGVGFSSTTHNSTALVWGASTGYVSGYRIYRDDWTFVGSTNGRDSTRFNIGNLAPATTHGFFVVAVGAGGRSEPSATASVRTHATPPPPASGGQNQPPVDNQPPQEELPSVNEYGHINISNPNQGTWKNIRQELYTAEEIRESDLRVAIIGELIKARQSKNISQRELEELSGVKQPIISRMESGETSPQLDTVLRVLAPLGKTLAVVPLDN